MTKDQKENSSQLKPYQVFLLSCLLGSILILNSVYVNKSRDLIKLNKEKGILFNKIINGRKLQEGDEPISYSDEVCSRGSKSLIEYYETGDLSKIDLENAEIKCENSDSGYMKALIDIVKSFTGDGDEEEDEGDNDGNPVGDRTPSEPGDDDRLRNLESEIDKEKIMEYGSRILPMLVFFLIGILSIIGWIVCCFCCCCNCCCCCCCKKPTCKIACFIFTYVFYGLVVGVCVYGLTQSNKIFVGLANTECSLLKFFDQVLYGETKQELPRWAGIRSINDLLSDLNGTINTLSTESYQQLNSSVDDITNLKENFVQLMHSAGDEFYDAANSKYKYPYVKNSVSGTSDYLVSGDYVYDTVYMFGRYDAAHDEYTENSFLYYWDMEYSLISDNAFEYLGIARDSFTDILSDNLGEVQGALGDGVDALDEIMEPFTDVNDEIGEILSDYSEMIDKYGKMGVKIIFGVLMAMNVALAVLLLLICLFSGRSCTSCCFCRCIFKFCTHILWNILALMMILTFIFGGIISLVGRLGGDMMSLVSYIMSAENFNKNESALLINELGDASKYIRRCIHGDGAISQELGLGDSLDSFDDIYNVENNISSIRQNFTEIINNLRTYYLIKDQLEKQNNHTQEVKMIHIPREEGIPIVYSEVLNKINAKVPENKQWDTTENTYNCDDNLPSGTKYYPKSCLPKSYPLYTTNGDFKIYADFIDGMDYIVKYANEDHSKTSSQAASVKNVLENLKDHYYGYLRSYISILQFFENTIHSITGLISRYSGNDGDAFAFLNGQFIGTNLKIILKYLKHSLGEDFYTVGICLVIVGFSLILSISSTILLIVIINTDLQKNINDEKNQVGANTMVVSEFQQNYGSPNVKY